MKKNLLILIFLILSLTSLGARFIVNSEDGYANIRYRPMVDSELVDVLSNGEYVTKLNEVGDWYYIEFTAYNYGYIHKSQLKKYTK